MHIKKHGKKSPDQFTTNQYRPSARRNLSVVGKESEQNEWKAEENICFRCGGKTLCNLLSASQKLGSPAEAHGSSPTSSLGTIKWFLYDNVHDKIFHELKWQWRLSRHTGKKRKWGSGGGMPPERDIWSTVIYNTGKMETKCSTMEEQWHKLVDSFDETLYNTH